MVWISMTMQSNWKAYGKTVGEPDPKREKGFKAIAHTYSDRTAARIASLPKLVVAAESLLSAFGGDVPEWLRTEASALAEAIQDVK